MVTPSDLTRTEKTGGSQTACDVRGRILIVDDSRTQLLKMSKSVEMLGHEAVTCADGASALGELSRGNIDVVLLDMVMPGMDGFAVLEKMKASEQLRDVPVIVISSLDEDMDSVARAIELGASDFLSKDYNPVVLRARIRAGLERRRARTIELDYLRQVAKLTQAAAVLESGAFNPRALNIQDVANRPDGLGTLATVFMSMAQKVYEREQAFRTNHRHPARGLPSPGAGLPLRAADPAVAPGVVQRCEPLAAGVLDEPARRRDAAGLRIAEAEAGRDRPQGLGVHGGGRRDRRGRGNAAVFSLRRTSGEHRGDDPGAGQLHRLRHRSGDRSREGQPAALPRTC